MNGFQNNQLLRNYNNYQQGAPQFQNNALLQNNPMFQNGTSQINALQNHQIQQMKEIQKVKQLEKLSELQKKMSKDKLRDIIISPQKETVIAKKELEEKWKKKEQTFDPDRQEYYKGRTNQPYKNIIKNADYKKEFKDKKDLIVHRVTNADKEGVEEEFEHLQQNLEKHNNELKVIYSTSKEVEHKKEFEYNHKDKFIRIKHEAPDHGELKKDNIDFYKKEQKKLQGEKMKVDKIMESLITSGIINEEDIKEINKEEPVEKPKRIVIPPSQVNKMTKAQVEKVIQQQNVEEQPKPKRIVIAPQRTTDKKTTEQPVQKPKVIVRPKQNK